MAIADRVEGTGYSNYDGWVAVYYWQAMRLDSDNHQTGDPGDDETADGTTFTRVRWHNSAWQYMTTDGVWHYFLEDDQAVAYYMRHTNLTTEIITGVKDWGYDPNTDSGTSDTSGGDGQVALSVAVVYPDNTLSPTEENIYLNSTVIFNYWEGRDIGIIAPMNYSDEYEISKITVTDGTRNSRTNYGSRISENVWYSGDSIIWDKVETDSGSTWYDETVVWDSSMGTEPMVNGAASNITWSAKSTAKLVLIYLQPVQKESSLTVKWVDDSDGTEINSMTVNVANEDTFYNNLKQDSSLPEEGTGGSFTLDDDAYIVNSSNVQQTINKDITIMNVDPKYQSGLYEYVGAELSADGKTLTLHYNLDESKLNKEYIVDFGLPVEVPVSDLVDNPDAVQGVTSTSTEITYDSDEKIITYTPSDILTSVETVTVRLNFGSTTERIFIGFAPATNVYYEEGFAEYDEDGSWTEYSKGTVVQQTAEAGDEDANQYGYDEKYAMEAAGASNGTAAVSTEYGDSAELTFYGTGIDIYTNSTPESGRLFITVTNSSGSIVKVVQVSTALVYGDTSATAGQNVDGYNVPVATLDLGERDTYTVKLSHMKTTADDTGDTISIDGYRIYGTLDESNDAYVADDENNPTYVELRDQVLAALDVDIEESQYADEIAENVLSQVYSTAGTEAGAVLLSVDTDDTDDTAQDLLDNGPKNELYLRKNQSIVFKVTSANQGNVQIGLKALNGTVAYKINNGEAETLTSSTDMYYKLDVTSGEETTITITNTSDSILSITDIKFPGTGASGADETSFLGTLTEDDIVTALATLGITDATSEPEETYEDATLNLILNDGDGNELASAALTANGVVGETAVFAAADIETAVAGLVPEGYELADAEYSDVEVAYGESESLEFSASEAEAEEPAGDEAEDEEENDSLLSRLGDAIKNVVNTITNIFKSLFKW